MEPMKPNQPASDETTLLLQLAEQGDQEALGRIFERYHDRLLRIVTFRIDRRVAVRIDPADVVQESYMEALARLPEYLRDPPLPLFVWLRFLTLQRLAMLHRHHLGVQARAANREISLQQPIAAGATSAQLAARLLGEDTSPSQAAVEAERRARLQQVLDQMDEVDREILTLRHFEQLTNLETAQVLGLKPTAASNRYVRAIRRLKELLQQTPPFGDSSP
jgi:RNA polymerase sigma-70 factor (ECF subfamily)